MPEESAPPIDIPTISPSETELVDTVQHANEVLAENVQIVRTMTTKDAPIEQVLQALNVTGEMDVDGARAALYEWGFGATDLSDPENIDIDPASVFGQMVLAAKAGEDPGMAVGEALLEVKG